MLLWDDNRITDDGSTALSISEDVAERFRVAQWHVVEVDGHDIGALVETIGRAMTSDFPGPRAVIAHTIKGKGSPALEADPLCHIRTLTPDEVEELIGAAP